MSVPSNFYTYLWLRENGTPYYVGKGSGLRAFVSRDHSVNRPKSRARIFVENWSSEEKAFEIEKFYIRLFGRKNLGTGILHNRTDGGDGPSGYVFSLEMKEHLRKKSSQNLLGNQRHKGIPHSVETRAKISLAGKGRRKTDEHKRKIGLAKLGKKRAPFSQEWRDKLSAARRGRKTGGRGFGWTHSPETKLKMSKSATLWRQKRRENCIAK